MYEGTLTLVNKFEPRGISYLFGVIVRVKVVFRLHLR